MKEMMRIGLSSLSFNCTEITIPDQLNGFNHYSTRWILITDYWFKKILLHFTAIFFIALFSLALFVAQDFFNLPAITIASLSNARSVKSMHFDYFSLATISAQFCLCLIQDAFYEIFKKSHAIF